MFLLTIVFLFLVSSCSCLQEGEPCMSEIMRKVGFEGICQKTRECSLMMTYALKVLGEEDPMECGSQDGVKILCCPTGGTFIPTTVPSVTPTVPSVTPTVPSVITVPQNNSEKIIGEPCMSPQMRKVGFEGICKKSNECSFMLTYALKVLGEPEPMECGTQDGVKIVCCPTGGIVPTTTTTVPPVTSPTP